MRIQFPKLWYIIGMILIAFAAGYYLANRIDLRYRFLNTAGLLQRLLFVPPRGKLGPCIYYIPLGNGQDVAECQIIGNQQTDTVYEINIVLGNKFLCTFTTAKTNIPTGNKFIANNKFGVPTASLLTGSGHYQHFCLDVGLKGRILIKDNSNGSLLTFLNGKWVPYQHIIGNTFKYQGKEYYYDKASGAWHLAPPK